MTAIPTTSWLPGWASQRLRTILDKQARPVPDGGGIITAFRDGQVTLRSNRRADGYTEAVQEIGYQGVLPGDLVVSSMDAFAGAIGVSDSAGRCSPVYDIYAPRGGADTRYYAYFLRHLAWSGLIQSLAKGIRERSTAFDAAVARDLLLPVPPPVEQARIADYLDAETARIDHLVGLVRRRAEALAERLAVSTAEVIGDERWNREPLKRVARYREGPGVLSGDIRDSGVPLLRIVNLVNDTIVLEDLRYLDPDMVRTRWPHMRVRAGDLIVSGSAMSGLPVVVPEEAEGAVPWTGLIRMWPSTARLNRDYLRMFLGSSLFLDQVNLLRTGIGLQHWGPSHLAQVWMPVPPVDHQRAVARTLSDAREAVRNARSSSEAEVERLLERRRALITAAVTGQLEIPGVAA